MKFWMKIEYKTNSHDFGLSHLGKPVISEILMETLYQNSEIFWASPKFSIYFSTLKLFKSFNFSEIEFMKIRSGKA